MHAVTAYRLLIRQGPTFKVAGIQVVEAGVQAKQLVKVTLCGSGEAVSGDGGGGGDIVRLVPAVRLLHSRMASR